MIQRAALREPAMPIGEKLKYWGRDTIDAIHRNFGTQLIYPAGLIQPSWSESRRNFRPVNYGTGAGFDSFYFNVLKATEDLELGVRNWAVHFAYNYYLNFVDMGVGRSRPIGKVQRTTDALYNLRYMSSWNPREGSTSRPAIAMEFRHQVRRIRNYMAERYKYDAQVLLLNAFDGLELTLDGSRGAFD